MSVYTHTVTIKRTDGHVFCNHYCGSLNIAEQVYVKMLNSYADFADVIVERPVEIKKPERKKK